MSFNFHSESGKNQSLATVDGRLGQSAFRRKGLSLCRVERTTRKWKERVQHWKT